jgi:hypothetical protein
MVVRVFDIFWASRPSNHISKVLHTLVQMLLKTHTPLSHGSIGSIHQRLSKRTLMYKMISHLLRLLLG